MAETGVCEMCELLHKIIVSTTKLRAEGRMNFGFRGQLESRLDEELQRLVRYVQRLPGQSPVRRGADSVRRALQQFLDMPPLYEDNYPSSIILQEIDRFLLLAENEQEKHICYNRYGGGRTLTDICDDILLQFVGGDLPTARRSIRDLMQPKAHEITRWENMIEHRREIETTTWISDRARRCIRVVTCEWVCYRVQPLDCLFAVTASVHRQPQRPSSL